MKEWNIYTEWLKSKLPHYHATLKTGAEKDDIENLEKKLQIKLPNEFHELYNINNGDCADDRGYFAGAFLGFTFLSIDRIEYEWSLWKEYYGNDIFNGEYIGTSKPENKIKKNYANPRWIPIFKDAAGNYIGIDLDPDIEGKKGQIINFGRDEDNKIVISDDLINFLKFIADKVNEGMLDNAIHKENDGGYSYGLFPQSHLIDDLKKILYGGE